MAQLSAGFQVLIERDLPQGDHHAQLPEQTQFFQKIRPTGVKFLHARLIARRGTAHRGRDIAVHETKAVVSMGRMGLVREAEPMERFVEPVAATVSGEDTAGSIAAVGGWGQTNYEKTGVRVAETRHRASPIGPVTELPPFGPGNCFSIDHQSRTPTAGYDLIIQDGQIRHGEPV